MICPSERIHPNVSDSLAALPKANVGGRITGGSILQMCRFLCLSLQILKAVEKLLLTYSKYLTCGSMIVKVKLIKSYQNLFI